MSGIRLSEVDDVTIETPPAGKATLFLDDVIGPAYKDDTGTVNPLEGADGAPGADAPALTYLDHGNTGSSENIDVSAGDFQRLVLNAATVALTTSGWPASGTPRVVRLLLVQDGSGNRTVTWPAAVTFGSAGAPTLQTAGGAIDVVDLESVDGGTTIVASVPGRAGPAGSNGSNGTNGAAGAVGGAISIPYTFSTTTTDSDPGSGNLRLDNATQGSATKIRADLLGSDGTDWTSVLDSFDDASNAVLGHIRLFKTADPTKWIVCSVTSLATPSGYRNITVAVVATSGANPFANGDAITLAFSRAGDQGATVGSGTVTTVEEVDGSPTDSAVTKIVFPNGTLGIAAHVATYTPAAVTVPTSFVKRTSGAITLTNDALWHDIGTISDLSIAAVAGDVLEITLDGVVDNVCRFEVKMVTSGNFAGPGESSTQGIAGWANRVAGAGPVGGSIMFVVQSGDISGGLVAIRLRYTTVNLGATTFFATTGVGPLSFGAKNLGQ